MSFTNRKPFLVTERDLTRPWSGKKDGSRFNCGICGNRFKVGDTVRWIYANGTPGAPFGNFFVCQICDGEATEERLIARRSEMWKELKRLKAALHYYPEDSL